MTMNKVVDVMMFGAAWADILERIEQGMTTAEDAERVRAMLDSVTDGAEVEMIGI